jgi:predicted membrane GTPase involved in stress response
MYYDYPIEQLARSARSRFQMGFARMTMHLLPEFKDIALEPSAQGLKILGANELALATPGEVIRRIHKDDVDLQEPRVRLLYDTTVREPVMWVRAAMPYGYAESAVQDLVARGAEIEEVDWVLSRPIIRAKAPLRLLLGYPQTLATLSRNTADLRMWLSHYAPVPPEPGGDAA